MVEVALLASIAASRLILSSSSCSLVNASGRGLDLNNEHKKTTAKTPNTMITAWTVPDSPIFYVAALLVYRYGHLVYHMHACTMGSRRNESHSLKKALGCRGLQPKVI